MGGFQRCSGSNPRAGGDAQPAWHLLAGGGAMADDLAAVATARHHEPCRAPVGARWRTFASLLLQARTGGPYLAGSGRILPRHSKDAQTGTTACDPRCGGSIERATRRTVAGVDRTGLRGRWQHFASAAHAQAGEGVSAREQSTRPRPLAHPSDCGFARREQCLGVVSEMGTAAWRARGQ